MLAPRIALGLSLVAVLSQLGCRKIVEKLDRAGKQAGSSSASGPVTLTWEQKYQLKAVGTKGEATFFVTRDTDKPPLQLQASFHDFPPGTKISFAGEQNVMSDSKYWSTMVEIKPAIIKQSIEALRGPIELDLSLSIEVPGSPAASTKLPKQDVKEGLRLDFLKARDGGTTFGTDDAPAPRPRGVAVVSGYSDLEFIGAAKRLTDVDWVAIAENQKNPRTKKTCSFKEGPATLKIIDADVLLIDRRSGQKITSGVLKASDECPSFAFIDKADNSAKSTINKSDAVTWARTQLEHKSK